MNSNMSINNKSRFSTWKRIKANRFIYFLLIPGLIFYIVFAYLPMYGVLLAFQDVGIGSSLLGNEWIGLENFQRLFEDEEFWIAFRNTIIISFGRLITGFSIPIILAILINELWHSKIKKTIQTIVTFPHFLSWVIISGIIFNLLSGDGLVNGIIEFFGHDKYYFSKEQNLFRPLLYVSGIWKSAGWGSVIYLAAISGINPELYEAATIDGASRLQRIRYITWSGMKPVVVLMLLLSIGGIMNAGFEQIFLMYNPTLYDVSDIIDTYVYRRTFVDGADYGLSTAAGLFKSVINITLLIFANYISKRIDKDYSIF